MKKQTFKRNEDFSLSGVVEMGISSDSTQSKGFQFLYWEDSAGSTYPDKALTSFNVEVKELSAKWKAIEYSIDYDFNGGSDPGNPTSYYISSNTITLAPSQKDYYETKGWTDAAGTAVMQIPKGSVGNKSLSASFQLSGFTDIGMTMKFASTDAAQMNFGLDAGKSKVGVMFKDPNKTYVTYSNGDISCLNIVGQLTQTSLGSRRADIVKCEIGKSVTSIINNAFADCEQLTLVTIPSSVESIGNYAFYDCFKLTSMTISDGVKSIGQNAFEFCNTLSNITIPNSVTSIGQRAFESCARLTRVTLSESMTSIEDLMFCYCTSLESMTIPPSVTSIGDSAFYDCNNLTSVMIPSSVTHIGEDAFMYCSGLTSVMIPSSVTEIDGYAFSRCNKNLILTFAGKNQEQIDAMANKYWGLDKDQCKPGITS